MILKLDENGYPRPDGYVDIVYNNSHVETYFYSQVFIEPGISYVEITTYRKNKLGCIIKTVIPYSSIFRIVTTSNSEEYIDACNMFRLTCKHIWDEEHHLISAFCNHTCTICGFQEGLNHQEGDNHEA